jgi:hypothetical protein
MTSTLYDSQLHKHVPSAAPSWRVAGSAAVGANNQLEPRRLCSYQLQCLLTVLEATRTLIMSCYKQQAKRKHALSGNMRM